MLTKPCRPDIPLDLLRHIKPHLVKRGKKASRYVKSNENRQGTNETYRKPATCASSISIGSRAVIGSGDTSDSTATESTGPGRRAA